MISDLQVSEVQDDTLVCPISPAMRLALDSAVTPPGSGWVFANRERTGPVGIDLSAHVAKSTLAKFRMHSLRAALVTHGGDRFGWPPHVRAALLDHAPAAVMGGVTGAYVAQDGTLYLQERAAALGQWSDLLLGKTGDRSPEE